METRVVVLCLGLAVSLVVNGADPPRTGPWGAVDRAQGARHEAEKLSTANPPDLQGAAKLLEDTLAYLDSPEVQAWSYGNSTLRWRKYDTLRDLAEVYTAMGRRDDALHLLELGEAEGLVGPMASLFQEYPGFAPLRNEPRYQAIIAHLQAADRLWKVPNIAVPYREKLSVEERIAGLSLFWAEARQGFVYFDHVPDIEWDRVYLDFIPRVMAAETTADYYRVMMQLAPLLRDAHTNIYPPKELQAAFYARPPLRTERLSGKVYVTKVFSESLASRVRVGGEIVAIDGIPVDEYAATRVAPFVSSSTPQDRELRTYSYQLLSGDKDHAISLELRRPDGALQVEQVERKGYDDVRYPEPFEFRMLPGQVAYLSVDHFENPAGVKALEHALPQILAAKGLVLDLRRNGGGSTAVGLQILAYLTPDPLQNAKQMIRSESAFYRQGGLDIMWSPVSGSRSTTSIARKERYAGPVAVLIGPQTFSAAEDFVMTFDVAKRGILVGSPTGGSTGQPMSFALPGGGTARICVKRDTYPDGREFVGKGIAPDVAVAMTVEDLRAGRDPVLDRAVAELQKPR